MLVRRQLAFSFAGMILSTLAVSLLKSQSIHACPWSLSQFGGNSPFYPMLASLPEGQLGGHCWPGAHASSGFSLMAFFFAFRSSHPTFAYYSLNASLILGFAMGWVQMMRGAHFLSHNLWAGWIVYLVLVVFSTCCMSTAATKTQAE